jgi:D-alanyl-D-alanine dipeptidase
MTTKDEPLIGLKDSDRLLVEPIWINPIDEIEGPLYLAYIAENPTYNSVFVRQSVDKMLNSAADSLPLRYKLIVRAGHRPLSVQQKLLEMVKQDYLTKNPGSTKQEALNFARTFVSDPAVKLPPHCCGAAIDVDVLDCETGVLVDFGCPVNTDNEIAFVDSGKISTTHAANRQMLSKAMTKAGFAPFKYEWWHFSYGDQTWALYYKKQEIYGLIEPEIGQ